jgi:3',5'-nucleoside bisphosphate phosphatase
VVGSKSEKRQHGALNAYEVDLHIHTVLSPCTELAEMTPTAIVKTAKERGLDIIAICDHNSARNAAATFRAAEGRGLLVIPGMEIASIEEVHILGLFSDIARAEAMQDEVYARLEGLNQEEVFGSQIVVDEFDMVEDFDERLLIGATTLSIDRVVNMIHALEGLAIASHVDRQGFGIFGQLGFVPEGLSLDALEVSKRLDIASARKKYKIASDVVCVRSSDAHYLADIGCVRTGCLMAAPSFNELRKAFGKVDGRRILEPDK